MEPKSRFTLIDFIRLGYLTGNNITFEVRVGRKKGWIVQRRGKVIFAGITGRKPADGVQVFLEIIGWEEPQRIITSPDTGDARPNISVSTVDLLQQVDESMRQMSSRTTKPNIF